MAAASANSLGKCFIAYSKGALVHTPLAAAEGVRAMPRFYSGVKDHGHVTDWKSGAVVAGKTFGHGVVEGSTDIFGET